MDPVLFDPNLATVKKEPFRGMKGDERRFEFLSVFAWSYRKGWEILLDAYFSAFRATDPVLLRKSSYSLLLCS